MSKWSEWLNKLREKAASRGYTCDICGAELFDYPTHRICKECDDLLVKNDGKTCPKCGRATLSNGACLDCKSHLPQFTLAFSAFPYEGVAAQTVNAFKNGKRYLSWYFGETLAQKAVQTLSLQALQATEWLILPVPLTANRQKERGYNQAEELAYAMYRTLQKMGVECLYDTQTLIKRRDEHMQKHLSSKERFENAEGAYHLHKRKFCRDKNILLIDDILTTGATGNACAKLLLNAGAKCVYLCTVAATPERN
ncbi:MAG: ComF family protein [Clostridia bacterium]|nr:ComF family protein [Clostridia bacterium]